MTGQTCLKIKREKIMNIDDLNTSSKVTAYLRGKGKNIIPIVPGTKVPPKGFKLEEYFNKMCDYPITDNDSIAILHGVISNTFGIDIDMKNGGGWEDAIHVVAKDLEKILSRTMVVKTPKQGCHFIVSPIGDLPPKNAKYFNKEGIEIDIKTQGGYTLLPPSIHPEKQLGKYQFISETLNTDPTDWLKFEAHIAEKGFFLKEDLNDKNLRNDYNLHQLLTGKFTRGNRRRSLNSLYCKLRIRDYSEEKAIKKVYEVNRKCAEPLDEKEIQYNIKYAESFFQNIVIPSLDKNQNIKIKKKMGYYELESQLRNEYNFISHISKEIYYYSNGIYHKNGDKLIKKKCRQYWESIGIETHHIREIENIIRDKTMILNFNDNSNQEIFDKDYKKIILKNGMYDFDDMKLKEYDHNVLATIKHPIYYDKSKKCPKFDKFLDSCFDGDEIRITKVLEMMALCFVKKYIIQKGYVNYGIGSNGKSTFLNILRNMLGIQNTSSIPMQQFQTSQFMGYELRGKCANISADGGTDPITKTGYIKSVLGGDAIRCEQKRKDPFDFMPFVTLIFTFNELPVVSDSSDGFARKIEPIHWDNRFYGNKKDSKVDDIAYDSDERSGIFNKLIPIIKRLIDEKKLTFENTVEETKTVWLSRSDSFFRFKNEHIVKGANYTVDVNKVKEYYKKICDENGMTPVRDRELFNKISDMLNGQKPSNTRTNNELVRIWTGFTLDCELKDDKQDNIDKKY